jgi:hypothetical protein
LSKRCSTSLRMNFRAPDADVSVNTIVSDERTRTPTLSLGWSAQIG